MCLAVVVGSGRSGLKDFSPPADTPSMQQSLEAPKMTSQGSRELLLVSAGVVASVALVPTSGPLAAPR